MFLIKKKCVLTLFSLEGECNYTTISAFLISWERKTNWSYSFDCLNGSNPKALLKKVENWWCSTQLAITCSKLTVETVENMLKASSEDIKIKLSWCLYS